VIRRPVAALVRVDRSRAAGGNWVAIVTVGLGLGLGLGLAGGPARASAKSDPPAAAPGAPGPNADPAPGSNPGQEAGPDQVPVELTVVGSAADLLRVRSVIEPWPIGGSVPHWVRTARFSPIEILQAIHDSRAVVRCWIDVSDQQRARRRARLYFAAPSGQQFLVRDVELSKSFDELDRESLSSVLELSIKALLDNQAIGLTREQARAVLATREPSVEAPSAPSEPSAKTSPTTSPTTSSTPQPTPRGQGESAPPSSSDSPPPEPAPTLAESARLTEPPVAQRGARAPLALRFGVSGFYAAQSLGGGLPLAHGPGLLLEASGDRDRPGLGLWLSGQYRWPARYVGTSAGADVETVAARAGLAYALPVGSVHLGIRLGAGIDATRISPQPGTLDPTAMLTPERWTASLVFVATLGLWKELGSHISGGVEILADALTTPVHFDQRVSGITSEVAAPSRIRPGLLVHLGFF
jgi:hypothetical protein